MRSIIQPVMAALLLASAASAQMGGGMSADAPAPDCSAGAPALPAPLAGWATRSAVTAAASASKLGKATLAPGRAVDAALVGTADVHYVTRPEKPGGSVSYGGLFAFTVDQPGIYRVALGSAAWIDMLRDGKAVESSAHGHGPNCSGIRKMVDFPLTQGAYVLQIAANGSASLPLLVTRLP